MKFVEKRKSREMKSEVKVLILRENLPMWSLGTFGSDFRKFKEGNETLMPNPKQKTASNESKKANPCPYSILQRKGVTKCFYCSKLVHCALICLLLLEKYKPSILINLCRCATSRFVLLLLTKRMTRDRQKSFARTMHGLPGASGVGAARSVRTKAHGNVNGSATTCAKRKVREPTTRTSVCRSTTRFRTRSSRTRTRRIAHLALPISGLSGANGESGRRYISSLILLRGFLLKFILRSSSFS